MHLRAVLLLLSLLVLVVVSGFWLGNRLIQTPAPAPATPAPVSPRAAAVPTPQGTPTPGGAPAGYRLAGVAVGEPDSFAVIEAPNGATSLYRVDSEVAGLGRLVRIEAERVVVLGSSGEFDLWLAPAATATPAPIRTPKPQAPTPLRQRRAGGTTPAPEF